MTLNKFMHEKRSDRIAKTIGACISLAIDGTCIYFITHSWWWVVLGVSIVANFKSIADKIGDMK